MMNEVKEEILGEDFAAAVAEVDNSYCTDQPSEHKCRRIASGTRM